METLDMKSILLHRTRTKGRCAIYLVATISMLQLPLSSQESCLEALAAGEQDLNRQFDLEHDRNVLGQSFSCDAGFSASDALRVLEDFRYGFLYDSREHIDRSVRFPLTVYVKENDAAPEKELTIDGFSEWVAFKTEHFDPYERALIACATLRNVRIYKKWSGFAIGLGRIWFMLPVDEPLKVNVINVRPLEAELFLRLCVGESREHQ